MSELKIEKNILKIVNLHKEGLYVPQLLNQLALLGIKETEGYRALNRMINRGFFEVDWAKKLIVVPQQKKDF